MNATPEQILAALPQTQCARCGYPDCAAYAKAIHEGAAQINQCPPGGADGIARLARLTGLPAVALNPENGVQSERSVAFIDENWCIGCTLCIPACPVDAIVGSHKLMHTVIEAHCTGCELCIPACPVDCIQLESVTPGRSGWAAWSQANADSARARYEFHNYSRNKITGEKQQMRGGEAKAKLQDLATHSQITDPQVLDKKRVTIEAALARARARNPLD